MPTSSFMNFNEPGLSSVSYVWRYKYVDISVHIQCLVFIVSWIETKNHIQISPNQMTQSLEFLYWPSWVFWFGLVCTYCVTRVGWWISEVCADLVILKHLYIETAVQKDFSQKSIFAREITFEKWPKKWKIVIS